MDACVRCLRDGRLEELAGVTLIVSDASTIGGCTVFERVRRPQQQSCTRTQQQSQASLLTTALLQILEDTVGAVNDGRAQAQRVHAVAIDVAPSELSATGAHSVTDCYSDPCGWLSVGAQNVQQVYWNDLEALQRLAQADTAGWSAAAGISGPSSCCVAVAGLSTLLLRHHTMQVSHREHLGFVTHFVIFVRLASHTNLCRLM